MTASHLARNLESIRARIGTAARRAGRDPGEVTLVVVTKTAPPSVFPILLELGVTDVGENRVQQLVARRAEAPAGLRWHMIGHLQKNKVPAAIRAADLVHAIDDLPLAERVDQVAARDGRRVEALVQVNVSGEGSKSGLSPEELPSFLDAASRLTHLSIRGLMTMAPIADDPETVRPHFRALASLLLAERERLGPDRLGGDLSMGMTQDYAVAVEEGATLVRVGSAVFDGVEFG